MNETERFTALIGANIRDFQRKLKRVDKTVRQTATEAIKPIGANIREFSRKMNKVDRDVKKFKVPTEKTIGADISNFMRKAAEVAVVARTLSRDKVIIPIHARWNNYTTVMGQIANVMRSVQEVTSTSMRGLGLFLSPALVPIAATLAGTLASIGPMIGVLAASTFALAGAFGAAGAAAVAFGAVAGKNLKGVFTANTELKKLQEQMAGATTDKERAKITEEMQRVMAGLTGEEKKALTSMQDLGKTWGGITASLKPQTLAIFSQSMSTLGSVLTRLRPLFEGATTAVQNLLNSLNASLDTPAVKEIFDYLNRTGGPMLETIGKAIGNFIKGIGSMFVAFEPLTKSTADGFLEMSESFATWAAGLSKSEKFQSFLDYIEENMPKIKSIFSDALAGITYFFTAFGPYASDMMTDLQDMMKTFKEWSKSLGENENFKGFMDYIKENGPQVSEFISNLAGFMVELGKAMAPVGSQVLELVNSFLQWSTTLMQNNPWISQLIGYVVSFAGLLFSVIPWVIAFATSLGGPLLKAFKFLGPIIRTVATKILPRIGLAITGLSGPIGWIAMAVISLAILIWQNWDKIKATTAKTWGIIKGWFDKMKMWLLLLAVEVVGFVVRSIRKFKELRDEVKAKLEALVEAGKKAFDDFKRKVEEKIKNAVTAVKDGIGEMPQKIRDKVSDMVSAGADLVGGVIEGIKSKISEGLGVIGGLATSLIDRFKRDTDTNSPSRAFADVAKWFAPGVVKGINSTKQKALTAVSALSKSLVSAFDPGLAMNTGPVSLTYDTSFGSLDVARMEHAFSGEVDKLDLPEGDTYIMLDGKIVGRTVARHVEDETKKNQSVIKATTRQGK